MTAQQIVNGLGLRKALAIEWKADRNHEKGIDLLLRNGTGV